MMHKHSILGIIKPLPKILFGNYLNLWIMENLVIHQNLFVT